MTMRFLKISRGGQVSLPAAVRNRWDTSTVVIEDRGSEVLLRPAPDDPVAAAKGALAQLGKHTSDQLREITRKENAELERNRGRVKS